MDISTLWTMYGIKAEDVKGTSSPYSVEDSEGNYDFYFFQHLIDDDAKFNELRDALSFHGLFLEAGSEGWRIEEGP